MRKEQEETLKISMLASGSTGNCTYIETNQQRLLVDAGLSGKTIQLLMQQINRQIQGIDGILVTHEHSDHIKGVGILSRKYNIPIYANEQTWCAMENKIGLIAPENKCSFEPDQMKTFGDIDVLSFRVSHDAADPQFYAFQKGDKQFVMLTDTGYVSEKLKQMLKNATAYLIESNHEIEMLRYGSYSWSLKQRILSDKGHLSNEAGALAMVDLIGQKTQQIFLGHLSQENNTKELAMAAMYDTLSRKDLPVNEAFHLHMTDPSRATKLMSL